MTTALPLGLTLRLGVHVDSGRPRLRRRFEVLWGKTGIAVAHRTLWNLTAPHGYRHALAWTLWLAPRHQARYAITLVRRQSSPYGDLRRHRLGLTAGYGDSQSVRSGCTAHYADLPTLQQRLNAAYGDVPSIHRRWQAAYSEAAIPSLLRIERLAAYGDASILHGAQLHPYALLGNASVVTSRLALVYTDAADAAFSRSRLEAAYGEIAPPTLLRAALSLRYAEVLPVRARNECRYAALRAHRSVLQVRYALLQQAIATHRADYAIRTTDPVQRRQQAPWSVLEGHRLQAIANTPELSFGGQRRPLIQARLSCDEDSPFWIATIELAELSDFAAIGIGDSIALALGAEIFALIVDGKQLSRGGDGVAELRCEITAVSPAALLEAPFASTTAYRWADPVSARAAVESMVGPVDWQLPDWIVPTGRLQLEGVTPLAAARSVVAALGGLIESAANGSLICRRRHHVRVPDYATASVAHSLFDADVITARAQISPQRGFNRVTIANADSASAARDRVKFVPDVDDRRQGLVRAWPNPERPVLLVHTGHPNTSITPLGPQIHTESECVEFIGGHAAVQYPIHSIASVRWQHADLGAVRFDGSTLTATVPGYSLG